MPAAIIFQHGIPVRKRPDFTCAAIGATKQTALLHDAHSDAGAQGDSHQQFRPVGFGILRIDAQCIAIGVVVDRHGNLEAFFQECLERHFLPRRDVLRVVDDAFLEIHDGRDADADLAGLGSDDPADVCGKCFEGLLQARLRRKRGGRESVLDGSILYESQAYIGAAYVDTECHLFNFLQI